MASNNVTQNSPDLIPLYGEFNFCELEESFKMISVVNNIRYTDDKTLLAGTSLQKLLDLTKAVKRGLKINTEKTKYIVISKIVPELKCDLEIIKKLNKRPASICLAKNGLTRLGNIFTSVFH